MIPSGEQIDNYYEYLYLQKYRQSILYALPVPV
jgi:hypothetical protein